MRQNADVKKGCVTMSIIAQPLINRDASRPATSAVRLKSATITRKIKDSAKVPARVRLFRLLPENIIQRFRRSVPWCFRETSHANFFLRRRAGDDRDNETVM